MTVGDGLGAERSHRRIAEDIWGRERVAAEWSSDGWMRAQVRRWVPKAEALAAGGWHDLVPGHATEESADAPDADRDG